VSSGEQLGRTGSFIPQRGASLAAHQKAGDVGVRRDALETVVGRVVAGLAVGTKHVVSTWTFVSKTFGAMTEKAAQFRVAPHRQLDLHLEYAVESKKPAKGGLLL
jgi:hypothetical protein